MPAFTHRRRRFIKFRNMSAATYKRIYGKKPKYNTHLPARFRGTSKRAYSFKTKVARAVNQVAENKFLTNRYTDVTPKPFVHLATDGYQLSCNLGDAVSDYSGQGFPLASGLECFNVLPAQRDGDYIFGKKLVTRLGIYMKPVISYIGTDNLAPDPKSLQFNLKVLKINAKYTPNGQQGSNVLSTQCWIDEANKTTGFADARNFTQLDLKTYLVNKRRFNVLRDTNFTLVPPSVATDVSGNVNPPGAGEFPTSSMTNVIPAKGYATKKYFSIVTKINKKLYYDPAIATTRPPTNYNDSIYILITATAPNDTTTSQLANKWSLDMTNTFIYTDM